MKKKKIWTSMSVWLASFLFISSWVVFGVTLALKTANVGLNGNVTFTATAVYAKVSGSVTGTATTNTLNDITINASTTDESQSWDNVNFDFKDENTPIVTTITVENLSDERSIWLTFTENISVTNITLARTSDGNSVTSFSVIEIPAKTTNTSSSKSFTITMNVDDKNKNVSGTFNFNVELSSEEPPLDASLYSMLNFSYSTATKTASVSSATEQFLESEDYYIARKIANGDIVIPSKVMYNNEVYTITHIADNGFGVSSHYDDQITSIVIPETVTSIGRDAFSGNNELTSVTIPSSVISIGDLAFYSCTSLTSITIPKSVKDMAGDAFCVCTNLTSAIFENRTSYNYHDKDYDLTDPSKNAEYLRNATIGHFYF